MTQHDDLVYPGHMLETAIDAIRALEGVTYEEFTADTNLQLATAHRVQVIGEAARRVSVGMRETLDLPWTQMIGMRHKIVHDYMGTDFDIVLRTATDHLPKLVDSLRQYVSSEHPE
jgi:uncharacterized protein with HEPN domain